jgi:hypothetical protein
LVKLVPHASRMVVDRSQWAWSFVMYPTYKIFRAYSNLYLGPGSLTHDSILISCTRIIGKAGVVADCASADHRMRALHFVG